WEYPRVLCADDSLNLQIIQIFSRFILAPMFRSFSHLRLQPLALAIALSALWPAAADAQISAPGADRERQRLRDQMERPVIDRDSITIRDTVVVFDPVTYEQTVTITVTTYSLRNY